MKNKIKVYFILPTLFAGGAEKVVSFISQNLDCSKFDVVLIVIGFQKESKYTVDQITVLFLNKKRVLNAVFSIIKLLNKKRPDIVLSTISHLNAMMGLISILFPKIKFIARQATINKVASKFRKPANRSILNFRKSLYNFGIMQLDHIICQSLDMKKDFLETYDVNKSKISVIHNPVTNFTEIKTSNTNKDTIKNFITIGRLGGIKGYLRVLDILSKIDIPFKYTIIGEGNMKDTIFKKIEDLNLTDKIYYIPHTNNVFKYLVENDMYLQGSFSEGFPNALLESCTVGTPVIAFNVPGGTKEIVEHGVNGFLVEDGDEESYLKYLQDDRSWNPITIRDSVYKKFNKEKIIKDYENLFLKVLKD